MWIYSQKSFQFFIPRMKNSITCTAIAFIAECALEINEKAFVFNVGYIAFQLQALVLSSQPLIQI
jgi:hypothetical protein